MRANRVQWMSRAVSATVMGAVIAFVPTAQAQGIPSDKLDIAGVRLGMTEVEVRTALQAFDASMKLGQVMGTYNYSDGANPALKTPAFLDRLEGMQGQTGRVTVYFSGPLGDVRVIGVSRTALMVNNQPTHAQFTQGLLGRYGEPSGYSTASKTTPVWESAGKPSCVRVRDHKGQSTINIGSGDFGKLLLTSGTAEKTLSFRVQAKGLMPSDLTQCGAYLSYFYAGDPVRNFDAYLYDLGAMITSERSRAAWVRQLQSEAVRTRQGQGQVPKF